MRKFRPDEKEITAYDSVFTALPIANVRDQCQVLLARLTEGNKIGWHQAAVSQRLICLSGKVSVRGIDNHFTLEAGEGVEWLEKEWHETVAIRGALLLIVEAHSFE
ncbi:hypothetical protein [Bacillus sp. JCM 19041]|uniref:hypothetical protein n=1 Tax=Bacillus sp. JCM 19041 TaxID=1460637 RepID=UPI0006D1422E